MTTENTSPDARLVADFLSGMIVDLCDGKPVSFSIMKDMKAISAMGRLKGEGKGLISTVLNEVDKKNPQALDLIVMGLGETAKAKIRKALG